MPDTDPWAGFEPVTHPLAPAPAFPGVIHGAPDLNKQQDQQNDNTRTGIAVEQNDRDRAKNTWTILTPDEASALKLPMGPTYQRNGVGEIKPVGDVKATADPRQATVQAIRSLGVDLNDPDDRISKLIRGSTSGGLETAAANAYGYVTGEATSGMENIGKLKTDVSDLVLQMTGGGLGNQVSDADRKFMEDRAGAIADPSIPANQRLAAWQEVKARMQRILGQQPANGGTKVETSAAAATIANGTSTGPGGNGGPGTAIRPTNADTFANGLQWGDPDTGAFDRAAYLKDVYHISAGQEDKLLGGWNANSGNKNLDLEGGRWLYQNAGMEPPDDATLQKQVDNAKKGIPFHGIDTTAAEQAYKAKLDAAIKARRDNPENAAEAAGTGTAQGILLNGTDEVSGIGGAVNALVRGQNPVAGYQVERDIQRRVQERSEAAHPVVSFGGNLAGGALTAPVGVGEITTTVDAAKAGARIGALAGFNSGQGVTGSLVGTGLGAMGGAATAAGAHLAAPVIGAALRPVGRAISSVLPRTPPPTAEQAALIAAGERQGVPLRQADVRPELRADRAATLASEKGGNIIRAAETADKDALEAAVTDKLTGSGTPQQREVLGDNVQSALDGIRKTSAKRIGARYDRARQLEGGQRYTPSKALAEIDAQIADLEQTGKESNRALIGYLKDIRSDLSQGGPVKTGILDAKGNPITRPPEGLTIDALRNQRTNMRGQINERNLTRTDAERRVGKVLDAASEDIAAGMSGNKAALGEFNAADKEWRLRHQFIKQVMEKVTGPENNRKSGSAAAATLEGWVKGDFVRFRRLWAELGPDDRDAIRATVAENLGRDHRGNFSLASFLSQTEGRRSSLSPKSARLIFGEDGVRALTDLRAIANAKQAAASETNYSRTGSIVKRSAQGLRTLLLAGFGFHTGGPVGAAAAPFAGRLIAQMGEKRAARLLLNPDYTRWLRRLPDTADPREIDRQFGTLDRLAARTPGMVADVADLKQALVSAVNDNAVMPTQAVANEQQQQDAGQ